jgi:hypothetical protein
VENEAQQHRHVPFVFELTTELCLVLLVRRKNQLGREAVDPELSQIDGGVE